MKDSTLKIAIIGASSGQEALYLKAKEMGLHVIGFACDKGNLTPEMYDEFHEISVTETDTITDICRRSEVDGVVTNASEFLIPIASEIADRLELTCTPPETIRTIQNKNWVRVQTEGVEGLSFPRHYVYPNASFSSFPCVVKPVEGASKKGVSFCSDEEDFENALRYADDGHTDILVEEYIGGREFSVETLSFKGSHNVVQITDKDTSGPPHFVELGHHQPSSLTETVKQRIRECVAAILDRVGFRSGATHVEMKYDGATDRLFLIEINCRGGGDHISDTLVGLSTDCDYIKEMIEISLGRYSDRRFNDKSYSGICYLAQQNRKFLKYFTDSLPEWIIQSERFNDELSESTSNYDRDGFFIYKSDKPVNL